MYSQGILQRKNDCKHPTLEFQIAFMCHNHKLRNKRPLVGALEQASFTHIFQYPSLWCCLEVGPHSSSSSSSELSAVTIFFMNGSKTATKLHETSDSTNMTIFLAQQLCTYFEPLRKHRQWGPVSSQNLGIQASANRAFCICWNLHIGNSKDLGIRSRSCKEEEDRGPAAAVGGWRRQRRGLITKSASSS